MPVNIFPRVEEQLKDLEGKSDDDLLDVIGAYAISSDPSTLKDALAVNGYVNRASLHNAATAFIQRLTPILQDVICGKDGVLMNMENPGVKEVVAFLLPALGLSASGLVPMAVVALSFMLVRSGLREYCKALRRKDAETDKAN